MSRLGDIVTAFEAQLDDNAVTVVLGRKELHRHASPSRVTFIPIGGTITAPEEIGRQDVGSTSTRTLYQRQVTCEVHCRGVDITAAENLMHATVRALHDLLTVGAYVGNSERWLSEEEIPAGDVVDSAVVVLEVGFVIPITDADQTLWDASGGRLVGTGTFGANDEVVCSGEA